MSEEKNLYDTLNDNGHLEGLDLDKDFILNQIGLGRVKNGEFQWADLNTFSIEECYDTCIKCVRFQEYTAEHLALTQRRRGTLEANLDKILNTSIANSSAKGMKITEARAFAKGSDSYTSKLEEVETLKAWEDYLDRFIDLLEKFHYLSKAKLAELQNSARK